LLDHTIRKLIDSKREGSYWDFKELPHENNASLLHDVLCLANVLHDGERYLIFGVSDPKDGASIKGFADEVIRKSQVQFIDFIRAQSFAGDIRPELELHTLVIDDKEIDVLVIFNSINKPFYLTEDYKNKGTVVKANHIYTRSNDTNTPINKSADINIVEKMWKERFGFGLSPAKRMELLLLKPEEWFKDIGNKDYAYHHEFPEFRIEFSDVNEFWEPYSFFFTNEKSFLGDAVFKYHSTTLFELEFMFCDEMRIELSVPDSEYLRLDDGENWYYYFDLTTVSGKFLYFLTDGLAHLNSRGSGFPFIIFENETERKDFNQFIIENQALLFEIEPTFLSTHAKKVMRQQNKESIIDPDFVDRAVQLHKKWKGL
jgi:hypothetical protein